MRKLSGILVLFLFFCSAGVRAQVPDQELPRDTLLSKPEDSSSRPDTEKYLIDRKTPKVKREVFRKYIACDVGMSRLSIPMHMEQLDRMVPSMGLCAPLVNVTFASQKRPHCYFSQSIVMTCFAQTASYGEWFGGDPHTPGYTQSKKTTIFSKFSFVGWAANLNLEFGKKLYWGTKLSAGLGLGGLSERFWKYYHLKTTYGSYYEANLTEETNGLIRGGMGTAFYTGASFYAGYCLNEKIAISLSATENIWLLPHDRMMFRSYYYREDGWKDRADPAIQIGVRYTFAVFN